MLEQLVGPVRFGAFRWVTNFGVLQRHEHESIAARGVNQGLVLVVGSKCQSSRFDLMDNVFAECASGNQRNQFGVSKRIFRGLSMCRGHKTAEEE